MAPKPPVRTAISILRFPTTISEFVLTSRRHGDVYGVFSVVLWAQSMTIAHVCLGCARDLAGVRAIRDPHYALPIVHCPGCGKAAVRRTHPFHARWIASLRIGTALGVLLVQHAIAAALILATFAVMTGTFTIGFATYAQEVSRVTLLSFVAGFVAVSVLTGAWLTAGLSHIAWWKAWIGWMVLILGLSAIGAALLLVGVSGRIPDLSIWALGIGVLTAAVSVLLGIIMVLALAGIPLGKLLLIAHRGFVRERFRWRRRRRALGATVL